MSAAEKIEVGTCPKCGEVESDGEFEFEYGPRCPYCENVLTEAWMEERPSDGAIISDTTAEDLLGGGSLE